MFHEHVCKILFEEEGIIGQVLFFFFFKFSLPLTIFDVEFQKDENYHGLEDSILIFIVV